MEQHPRDVGKMENKRQGLLQQLLNEDGTLKNWDEGIGPRVIRDRYELFIHEDFRTDFSEAGLEEKFEDTPMSIHDGGFKRRIIADQAV